MAQNETWLNHDLLNAVKVQYLDGNLFSMDNAGNLIGVKLTRDGVDYSGGGSVSASVIRSDGGTVAVVGALSGNVATVVLPQAAYAVPGVVSIVVKLTVSGQVTTIAAVVANVYQSSTDSAIDPGTIIPSVQTLIAAIDAAVASIPADYSALWTSLAPAFSTSVNYTAGQYVTYNGALYRFTTDHSAGAWNSAHVTATNLGADVSSLKSAITQITDNTLYTNWIGSNKYIALNASTTDVTNPSTSIGNCQCIVIPAVAGDVFTITATGGIASRAYGFVASDGTVVEADSENTERVDYIITAPENNEHPVANLVVNDKQLTGIVYGGISVDKRIKTAYDQIDELQNTFLELKNVSQNPYTWEKETINSSTGENAFSNSKIRTVGFHNPVAGISIASGYKAQVFVYNENKVYQGTLNGTNYEKSVNWHTGNLSTISIPNNYFVRYVLATSDESTSITANDNSNISILTLTDETLTHSGKAADAKEVGDRLAQKVNIEALKPISLFVEKSTASETIEIASYISIVGFINVSNVYKNLIGFTSNLIPIDDVISVYVKANSNSNANISFLQNATLTPDVSPSFSIEYPERILIESGEEAVFAVPVDAKYLLVANKGLETTVYKPETVRFTKLKANTEIDNSIINLIRSEIYNNLGFAITDTGRDIPENRGVLNAYKKAHQLLDVEWTALNDVPTLSIVTPRVTETIDQGETGNGIPYSSPKEKNKYVGMMVSLKTFMTAVHNPYSLLYTEVIYGPESASDYGFTYHGTNCASYYGMVCSMFVETALGFNVYYDTDAFEYLCNIGVFEKNYDQSAYGLKLMDVYWRDGHTKLVTDIYRDDRGNPTLIKVSESAGVYPYTTDMTPEQFDTMLANENGIIYRYTELYKNLEYTPSEFVKVENEPQPTYTYNEDICTFAGDYAVFHANDTIYLNYTLGNYTAIELYKNDTLIQTLNVSDASVHKINISEYCSSYGVYKARLTGNTDSEYTHFVVLDTTVSMENENNILAVSFSSQNATPVYAQLCDITGAPKAIYEFSQNENNDGMAHIDAYKIRREQYNSNSFGSNTIYLKVFFKHPWGMTSSVPVDTGIVS